MAVLRTIKRIAWFALVTAAVGLLPATSLAQPSMAREYEVKAAFLFSFAKFVEWPPTALAGESLVIGILGADPFGPVLDKVVADQNVHGKKLTVRRFDASDDVTQCHILFIGRSEDSRLTDVFTRLDGAAV